MNNSEITNIKVPDVGKYCVGYIASSRRLAKSKASTWSYEQTSGKILPAEIDRQIHSGIDRLVGGILKPTKTVGINSKNGALLRYPSIRKALINRVISTFLDYGVHF